MKKVFAALLTTFVLVVVVFVAIGGAFNRQFWLGFLPGLIENLVALTVAVFVIDGIYRHERLGKLERTNESKSRFVLFLTNRMAYLILQYFGLATKEEAGNDPEFNFGFARSKLRTISLSDVYYESLMGAKDKESFTEKFTEMLFDQIKGISKAMDDIYPRPDPVLKQQIEEQMTRSIGTVDALRMLFRAFKAANAELAANQQLKPEHLDLLIKVGYTKIGPELEDIQRSVIQLSERAEANRLFITLD